MPKAELHCHLDGSLRPETMLELAREHGIALPRENPNELRHYMCADNVADLADYLHRFDTTISILQTESALERVAYELVQDASLDGIRYIEVRNAPHLNTRCGLTVDQVLEATMRGLNRGEAEFGTIARFITCSLRHWDPARSLEAALCDCNASRIGHGVRAEEDPALLEYIRDLGITLEMCPTSNEQTHAVVNYAQHPLRRYLHSGVRVTINTDSRLISGVTLTDEYARAVNELGLTIADLCACVINACEAAFLPLDERTRLVADVRAELQRDWGYQA